VPAATPVLLNLAMIGAVWLLVPVFARAGIERIYALAAGVMLGGVLQLAVQIPALWRIGVVPRIGLGLRSIAAAWHHPAFARSCARWRRRCSASRSPSSRSSSTPRSPRTRASAPSRGCSTPTG
jgi:hypothetical protein